jgi:hypothetical protein
MTMVRLPYSHVSAHDFSSSLLLLSFPPGHRYRLFPYPPDLGFNPVAFRTGRPNSFHSSFDLAFNYHTRNSIEDKVELGRLP